MDEPEVPEDSPIRAQWIRACSAALLRREPQLGAAEADDIASTLWFLPRCRSLAPQDAATRLFQGRLSPAHWDDPVRD